MGRRRITLALFVLVLAITQFACKKKTEVDGYTEIPEITILSVTPTTVEAFDDSISILIEYKDLNGDIGQENPDEFPLMVKDRRTPAADFYHVPPITPDLQEARTKGVFNLILTSLFRLGNDSTEKTSFTISLTDRAGNVSNTVQTPDITIIETN